MLARLEKSGVEVRAGGRVSKRPQSCRSHRGWRVGGCRFVKSTETEGACVVCVSLVQAGKRVLWQRPLLAFLSPGSSVLCSLRSLGSSKLLRSWSVALVSIRGTAAAARSSGAFDSSVGRAEDCSE